MTRHFPIYEECKPEPVYRRSENMINQFSPNLFYEKDDKMPLLVWRQQFSPVKFTCKLLDFNQPWSHPTGLNKMQLMAGLLKRHTLYYVSKSTCNLLHMHVTGHGYHAPSTGQRHLVLGLSLHPFGRPYSGSHNNSRMQEGIWMKYM